MPAREYASLMVRCTKARAKVLSLGAAMVGTVHSQKFNFWQIIYHCKRESDKKLGGWWGGIDKGTCL